MKKQITFYLTSCLLFISIAAYSQPLGWGFIRSITVSNSATVAAVNYQLKLIVNTQTIITANQMQATGNDIRFGKNCTGTTLYNYWLESGINTPTTTIWVKIDTIPANGTRTFFMYHGNSTVTAVSSIPNVFSGPNSSTDSVASGSSGGAVNSQRGFRFTPTEDLLVTHFGKREPNGTPRTVTLFDFTTQAIVAQGTVTGAAAQYNYNPLNAPIWMAGGTQYILSLYQGPTDGYYFGTSSQIGQHMTYGDMRYCNSCAANTFPTSILTNFHYGYPDLWYFTRNNISPAPTYTFNNTAFPVITVNSGNICIGQSFTMVPSGASTYTFSNGNAVVSPSVTSSYSVTGTNSLGCVSSAAAVATVTVNAIPVVTVNSGNICTGQSFTMVPSGASTYTFSNGNAVVSPSVTTSYSVTGTNSLGCVSSAAAVASVTVNANPVITVNSGSICAGQNFTIVPSGALSYSYSNGSNVLLSLTSNTVVSVIGSNSLGCTSSAVNSSVTVVALPNVTVSSSASLICAGNSVSITAAGATTYSWSNSFTTTGIVVSPSVTTTYSVIGTSAGCSKMVTFTQNVSPCLGLTGVAVNQSAMSLFPNPNKGIFTLELVQASKVKVTNLLGEVQQQLDLEAGSNIINLSHLANGIYFIEAVQNGSKQTVRVVKE